MRKALEIERCPLHSEIQDGVHILIKCSKPKNSTKQFLNRKWLIVNEEIACKKIHFTNVVELRNIGNYLDKIMCECEKET